MKLQSTKKRTKSAGLGFFRHPNDLCVMSCESPAVVKRENETAELPHLSGAVGPSERSHGNPRGPMSRPPPRPFLEGELRNEKEEALE